jgi:hypothetical protein
MQENKLQKGLEQFRSNLEWKVFGPVEHATKGKVWYILNLVKLLNLIVQQYPNGHFQVRCQFAIDSTDANTSGFVYEPSTTQLVQVEDEHDKLHLKQKCIGYEFTPQNVLFGMQFRKAARMTQLGVNLYGSYSYILFFEPQWDTFSSNFVSDFEFLMPGIFDRSTKYMPLALAGELNCKPDNCWEFKEIFKAPWRNQLGPIAISTSCEYQIVFEPTQHPFYIRDSVCSEVKIDLYGKQQLVELKKENYWQCNDYTIVLFENLFDLFL